MFAHPEESGKSQLIPELVVGGGCSNRGTPQPDSGTLLRDSIVKCASLLN